MKNLPSLPLSNSMKDVWKPSQRRLVTVSALLIAAWSAAVAAAATTEEILKAVDDVRAPGPTFTFDLKLTYTRPRKEPIVQKYAVSVKDGVKSLVKVTAPEDVRGRVLLAVGQNMWLYVPTVNQPVRVSARQRLLGTVSNADVARVVFSYDYSARLLGAEDVDSVGCQKLELSPKTEDAAYGRILLWAQARTDQPVQAQFYATTGKLLKTAFYKDYHPVLGKQRPMLVEIKDEIRGGEVSRLVYSNFRIANTPDSQFTKENLRFVR